MKDSCQKPFRIVSDTANERHEMLVFDCHQLFERKQYMYCILNLTMAYEMFFSLFLRVELLYKLFIADPNLRHSEKLDRMNTLSRKLERKTRGWAFGKMRNIFLSVATDQLPVPDLDTSERRIASLNSQNTSECRIRDLSDREMVPFLVRLKHTDINVIRNAVVHKRGYRPTGMEAEKYLEETKDILFNLTRHLDLHDNLNYWIGTRSLP
ncbi:MAG: hypothetical protein OXG79_00380 [Chloroflexi bacterium]|nr:hypothetical protein [Chloroflexota bacterium]